MKKKTSTLKPTKKQLKEMKRYWKLLKNEEETHFTKIREIEKSMEEQTGIEGIEFFLSEDGYYCGVGNSARTVPLIHANELEKK